MVVQHNISAMTANRYYGINNKGLAGSLEKLASGYAINKAGDNAAGLAVSEKMRAQIGGLTQASKNAEDGISMVQTYEGALQETDSILQRMRTLAVQSANGSYQNDVDRDAIQLEFNQLNDELNQIADTDFNGVVALNGGTMADGTVVNVASKVSQKPSIEQVASAGEATFPYRTGSSSATFGNLNAGGDGNLNIADAGMQNVTMKGGKAVSGNSEPYYLDPDHTDSSSKVEAELELDAGQWKGTVTATVNKSVASGLADGTSAAAAVTASSIKTAAGLDAKVTFKATTDGSGKVTLDSTDPTIVEDVKDAEGNIIYAAGSKASDAGITVAVNPDDDKKFLISSVIEYEVNKNEVTNKKTGKGVGTIESPIIVSEANAFKHADSNLTYADHIVLQVGARAKDAVDFTFSYRSNGLGDLKADMDASARGLGTDQLKLTDQESANLAIDKIDNAINKVSMIRGTFGAIQNRLEHKISNIDTNTENLTAAESRIRDTQMDKEMMKFTSSQILSQASQSMLAQANSLPQGVLQLLG